MSGPCIVTTKRRLPADEWRDGQWTSYATSRHAVATLDEAQAVVFHARPLMEFEASKEWSYTITRRVTESGGTVTLPDGTVIEVEATTWQHLADVTYPEFGPSIARRAERGDDASRQRILDAYNTRQGVVTT